MKRTLLFFILFVAILSGIVSIEKCKHDSGSKESHEVKNLIYMIGDGMGLSHISMLVIESDYKETSFQSMSNIALISTRSANNRVTDSAAAGTALATGVKTCNSMLGVDSTGRVVSSLIERAEQMGLSTGIVVTSEIYHATPASFYAHVENRGLSQVICEQLSRSGIDVLFGGGLYEMSKADSTGVSHLDRMASNGYTVAKEWEQVEDIMQGDVIALFSDGHLPSKLAGRDDYLSRATAKSLEILSSNSEKNQSGFVLMVEGSQIDFESHGNSADGVLAETSDFDMAIRQAMRFVDNNPGTLLVVTSDHETGGLATPSGNPDFTLSESGIDYCFASKSHTAMFVPLFLYGAGAESINGVMENSELAQKLMSVLALE